MRSREEAVKFTTIQLDNSSSVHGIDGNKLNGRHHYGKMEIQELLDFIYSHNSRGEKVETPIKVVNEQEEKT